MKSKLNSITSFEIQDGILNLGNTKLNLLELHELLQTAELKDYSASLSDMLLRLSQIMSTIINSNTDIEFKVPFQEDIYLVDYLAKQLLKIEATEK